MVLVQAFGYLICIFEFDILLTGAAHGLPQYAKYPAQRKVNHRPRYLTKLVADRLPLAYMHNNAPGHPSTQPSQTSFSMASQWLSAKPICPSCPPQPHRCGIHLQATQPLQPDKLWINDTLSPFNKILPVEQLASLSVYITPLAASIPSGLLVSASFVFVTCPTSIASSITRFMNSSNPCLCQ